MIAAGSAFILYSACIASRAVFAGDATLGYKAFRTEPDHHPTIWDVRHFSSNSSLLSPGYLFIAPRIGDYQGWGPQIYTSEGDLIWNGKLTTSQGNTGEFRACDWKGESGTHLCLHDHPYLKDLHDNPNAMHELGNRVFDYTYTQVGKNYSDTGDLHGHFPDQHEFNMISGGKTFLYAVMRFKTIDLRPYGSVENGLVKESCFQEADINTGRPIFTWRSLDYVDIWETNIFPNVDGRKNLTSSVAGDGSLENPWDYMHLNSVDKNEEGDYLISARHLDAIIKIAGLNNAYGVAPGTILWRLGGKKNDFELDFNFSKQHHVRYLKSTPTGDIISIFDNAWEGYPDNSPSAESSAGLIISTNNNTMKAKLLHRYPNPEHMLAGSRGSMSVLPNGNALIGWGHGVPQITEFSEDGAILYHAHLYFLECVPNGCGRKNLRPFVYRAHKQPWIGQPHWKPKLLVYSRTCNPPNGRIMAYVSWNGATEVYQWQFYTSSSSNGPWTSAGIYRKSGFETGVSLSLSRIKSLSHVRADALDTHGLVLASVVGSIFVPGPDNIKDCGDYGCPYGFRYNEHNKESRCLTIKNSGRDYSFSFSVPLAVLFLSIVLIAAGFEFLPFSIIKHFKKSSKKPYARIHDFVSKDQDLQSDLDISKSPEHDKG